MDLETGDAGPPGILPYETGIPETDVTVEEGEEDEGIEIISCFPLDQCSRTSPGNHATIRR